LICCYLYLFWWFDRDFRFRFTNTYEHKISVLYLL